METSSRDSLPIVTIALDKDTAVQLRHLLEPNPLAKVKAEMQQYLTGGQEAAFIERMKELGTEVLMIDFDRDREHAIQTVQRVREAVGDCDIFAVSSTTDSSHIIGAMRAGCNEYLIKPLKSGELNDALTRVVTRRKERRDTTTGRVLAFIGVKGGSGVTALSIHLAMLLADRKPQRVALVDLHRYLGDISLYMALSGHRYHFFDLVDNTARLDAELLRGYRVQHASGVDVLAAPDSFEAAHPVIPETVRTTLEFLQSQYRFVVVDCAPGLSDQNMEVIDLADQVYLIAQPEIPSLRNTARYLDHLSRSNFTPEKIRVVINRYHKKGPITEAEIEKAIHAKVFMKVPNDYREVAKTVMQGNPLSVESRSEFMQCMKAWAGLLTGAIEAGGKESKGMLSILRG